MILFIASLATGTRTFLLSTQKIKIKMPSHLCKRYTSIAAQTDIFAEILARYRY